MRSKDSRLNSRHNIDKRWYLVYGIGISQSEGVLPKLCTHSASPFQGPKGRTIRKLMGVEGGGGGGVGLEEAQKKYSRNRKLHEKNSCTPINSKKYSRFVLKTKKNSCGSKIPLPPPRNFSNGPSLIHRTLFLLSSGGLLLSLIFFLWEYKRGGAGVRRGASSIISVK